MSLGSYMMQPLRCKAMDLYLKGRQWESSTLGPMAACSKQLPQELDLSTS